MLPSSAGPGTALAAQTGMLAIGAVVATQWFAATTLEEGVVVDNTAEAAITTVSTSSYSNFAPRR